VNGPLPKKRQVRSNEPNSKKGHGENEEKEKRGGKVASSTLLDEIRALGGDESDLELVANIDSDAEDRQRPAGKSSTDAEVDEAFKNELTNFASSLGFHNLQRGDDVATDESAEDTSTSDISPENDASAPEESPKATVPGKPVSKGLIACLDAIVDIGD
jgi:ribosome biogenesis protein MAK21